MLASGISSPDWTLRARSCPRHPSCTAPVDVHGLESARPGARRASRGPARSLLTREEAKAAKRRSARVQRPPSGCDRQSEMSTRRRTFLISPSLCCVVASCRFRTALASRPSPTGASRIALRQRVLLAERPRDEPQDGQARRSARARRPAETAVRAPPLGKCTARSQSNICQGRGWRGDRGGLKAPAVGSSGPRASA